MQQAMHELVINPLPRQPLFRKAELMRICGA